MFGFAKCDILLHLSLAKKVSELLRPEICGLVFVPTDCMQRLIRPSDIK